MREKGYSALADLVLAAVKQTVGMDMESIKKTSNRGCSGGGGGGGSGVGGGGGGDSGGGRLGATPPGDIPRLNRGRGGRGGGWRSRLHYYNSRSSSRNKPTV